MPTQDFERASVELLKQIVEQCRAIDSRQRSMEQRQIRMETRLCRFIQTDGKEEVLHPRSEPVRA